jgi:hypothetical protein
MLEIEKNQDGRFLSSEVLNAALLLFREHRVILCGLCGFTSFPCFHECFDRASSFFVCSQQ